MKNIIANKGYPIKNVCIFLPRPAEAGRTTNSIANNSVLKIIYKVFCFSLASNSEILRVILSVHQKNPAKF